MTPARSQSAYDSGEDSDIQEIAVIPPKGNRRHDDEHANKHTSPVVKRRRSSPQMDPIPTYNPTPIHILEQRARQGSSKATANHDNYHYSQATYNPGTYEDYPSTADDDYVPLLEPSPHVLSFSDLDSGLPPPVNRVAHLPVVRPQQTRRKVSSSSTPRPVSSALAEAVNRRRNSLIQQQQQQQNHVQKKQTEEQKVDVPSRVGLDSSQSTSNQVASSTEYAQEPVMWSPKLPQQTESVEKEVEPISTEDYSKFQSVIPTKQRLAHKTTVVRNKNNRPRVPIGQVKKVPLAFRAKYLDVIITEFLNTGHSEEESYEKGLEEEKALAERALSKMTYVNFVAGFKKKLREKVGLSSKLQDEDPKFINGNKVVSHEEILTGKVRGTFSVERKRKISDPSELNEPDLYDRLSRYVMPDDQLVSYGYPYRDPDNPDLRMAPIGKDGQKVTLRSELASSYTCERCTKIYRVDAYGMPLTTVGKCIFHPGHLWNVRISRALERRYSCCKGEHSAGGCSSNVYHVHRGDLELENYKGYVETQPKPERDPNNHGIYALDCEMCHTTYGLELTRVTVVNHKNDVVYEKLVRPKNPILDYNTRFSGIKPGDLDETDTSLADVQHDLLDLFSDKTILVGHSLDSDMKALKIFHRRFIDTAQLFPHKRGLPYKRALRTLMIENLQVIIQEDAGHDSKEDACAALRLVMWKAKTDVPAKVS